MTTFSERLSMIPRIRAYAVDPELAVRPYRGWQLLEREEASGDILICKPCSEHDRTRSQHLLILVGPAAAAWLAQQETAPA